MTNREAVSKQIDSLAVTDRVRDILLRIYGDTPNEANTIRVTLSNDNVVMVAVGWGVIFGRDQVPLIWKHLKDTGEVDRWRHKYMGKQIETLDGLRKAIKSVEDGGNKILEQLNE